MKAKVFQIPSTLEGMATLKDGGMSLRFHTQELDNGNKMGLMDFNQKFGWLQFSESELQEIPKGEIKRDVGFKTPSQRLRATLFVYYSQSNEHDLTFDEFYSREMEKLINIIKENLR